jgi:proton-dependent oligopeptide transporter, POT family
MSAEPAAPAAGAAGAAGPGATAAPAASAGAGGAVEVPYPTAFFGHPRGLATLFFTEFWERFSYYGIQALLVLFATAGVAQGGLGLSIAQGTAIYGLYSGSLWLLSLPGGWVADRLLGSRRAVLVGGCLISAGNFSLAVEGWPTFYLGLTLAALGTGLLKPNISSMVGELYPSDYARRDAGFSIFYMGINLGAILSPLICGPLGERVNWHLGFAAAGAGMALGVVQFALGGRNLGSAGLRPNADLDARARSRSWRLLAGAGALVVLLGVLVAGGWLPITFDLASKIATAMIAGLALAYFAYQLTAGGLDRGEKRRMLAILVLFLFSVLFWSGYFQTASSLNLFAERLTDRNVFGWIMPATVLQSVNPVFIVLLAPVFAWIWIRLGRRNPGSPAKFALGLLFLALGFVTMVEASLASVGRAVVGGALVPRLVSPWWLVLTFLFHSCGELCLSPVGLSTVTKLAPRRKVSQMLGIWFMSLSLGNIVAGQIAGRFEAAPLFQIFGTVAMTAGGAALVLLLLVRPLRGLTGGAG